jgi:uncharacterized secreted repeat protein (TIGR03808 family)
MRPNRRLLILSGLGLAAVAGPLAAASAATAPRAKSALVPDDAADQTASLQAAIDAAAIAKLPLVLPPGTIRTQGLELRPGTTITGGGPASRLVFIGSGPFLTAHDCVGIALSNLTIDGGHRPLAATEAPALLTLAACDNLQVTNVTITNSSANGVVLTHSTGRIDRCRIEAVASAAIFATDSVLAITGNTISDCGDNGILVWRSKPGPDGSQVTGNRITGIRADRGGSGQNGNGVNVFRAGNVQVAGNQITDCAYSAVRGNAASNLQIAGNHCQRIGEVALYAEFGFEGVVITGNTVDSAATGISVTNFNEGGRLAVVQGNLIRNLVRREHEPHDKRGEGIAVEADAAVSGNTIENAPTCGLLIGWGRHMRDVAASGNVIRACKTGILISADANAGRALVTGNLISGSADGAIRAHDLGRPFGPDLARQPPTAGRVTITGNAAS